MYRGSTKVSGLTLSREVHGQRRLAWGTRRTGESQFLTKHT